MKLINSTTPLLQWNFHSMAKNQEEYYGTYTIPPQIEKNVAIDLGCNVGMFVMEHYKTFKKELYAF